MERKLPFCHHWELDEDDNCMKYFDDNGELHRGGDLPAVECPDGELMWFKNGSHHRDGNKPAIIKSDGSKSYYKNNETHREGDKPAEIWADGTKGYFKNGKMHRDKNKPAYINPNTGCKEWFVDGNKQKDNGKCNDEIDNE